jgi:hypothetical protein
MDASDLFFSRAVCANLQADARINTVLTFRVVLQKWCN